MNDHQLKMLHALAAEMVSVLSSNQLQPAIAGANGPGFGEITQQQKQREAEIISAFRRVDDAVDKLSGVCDLLADRISPVRLQIPSAEPSGLNSGVLSSPFGVRLGDIAARIEGMALHMTAVHESLAL